MLREIDPTLTRAEISCGVAQIDREGKGSINQEEVNSAMRWAKRMMRQHDLMHNLAAVVKQERDEQDRARRVAAHSATLQQRMSPLARPQSSGAMLGSGSGGGGGGGAATAMAHGSGGGGEKLAAMSSESRAAALQRLKQLREEREMTRTSKPGKHPGPQSYNTSSLRLPSSKVHGHVLNQRVTVREDHGMTRQMTKPPREWWCVAARRIDSYDVVRCGARAWKGRGGGAEERASRARCSRDARAPRPPSRPTNDRCSSSRERCGDGCTIPPVPQGVHDAQRQPPTACTRVCSTTAARDDDGTRAERSSPQRPSIATHTAPAPRLRLESLERRHVPPPSSCKNAPIDLSASRIHLRVPVVSS